MKKKTNINSFILFAFIILFIILAPSMNANIYARSMNVPASIKPLADGDRQIDFYKRVNAYYSILENLELYKSNEKFDRKSIKDSIDDSLNNPNSIKPRFKSKRKDLVNEGGVYIPRGFELMQSTGGGLHAGSMLRRPEITCSGHGIMLTGERGQIGHLDENGQLDPDLRRMIEDALVAGRNQLASRGTVEYVKIFVDLVYNEVKDKGNNIRWEKTETAVIGHVINARDNREYQETSAEITDILKDANAKALEAITLAIRAMHFGNGLNPDVSVNHEHGRTPVDNHVRGTNKYHIREHRQGARRIKDQDFFEPSDTISAEAGYIINEMYVKRFDDENYEINTNIEQVEGGGGGDTQYAIWANTEEGRRGEVWYGGTSLKPDPNKKTAWSLILDSNEFKKYWDELLDFCEDRGKNEYPNQEVIHSKQRDKLLKFRGEVPTFLPEKRVIKNPNLMYEPRFVEVNGKKPEDEKTMVFDAERQSYIVGPYKLDYLDYFKKDNGLGAGWFAALTNAKIYGTYSNYFNNEFMCNPEDQAGCALQNSRTYLLEIRKKYQEQIEKDHLEKEKFANEANLLKEEMAKLADKVQSQSNDVIEDYLKLKDIYNEIYRKYNEIIGSQKLEEVKKYKEELRELLGKFDETERNLRDFPRELKDQLNNCLDVFENMIKQLEKVARTHEDKLNLKQQYYRAKYEFEKSRKEYQKQKNKNQRKIENAEDYQRGNVDGTNLPEGKIEKEDLGDYTIKFHAIRTNGNMSENPYRAVAVGPNSGLRKNDLIYIDALKDKNSETYVVVTDDGVDPDLRGKEISIAVPKEDLRDLHELTANVKRIVKYGTRFSAKNPNLLAPTRSATVSPDTGYGSISKPNIPTYRDWKEDQLYNGYSLGFEADYMKKVMNILDNWLKNNNDLLGYTIAISAFNDSMKSANLTVENRTENADNMHSYIDYLNNLKAKEKELRKKATETQKRIAEENKRKIEELRKKRQEENNNNSGGSGSGNNNGNNSNSNSNNNNNNNNQNTGRNSSGENTASVDPVFNIENDEDAEINITDPEIKGWKFLVERSLNEGEYTEQGQLAPAPGETFYFEIPYDQNLLGISAIKFEFYHMVYGGDSMIYEGTNRIFGDIKDSTKVDSELADNGLTLRVNNVIYELNSNSNKDTPSQPLAYWASAKWFEKTVLVLRSDVNEPDPRDLEDPNLPQIPDVPKHRLSKFMVPINGKVWEDKYAGEKHLKKDNIYNENEDELVKGVKVHVYRVIGEKDGNSIKNIVEKQKARLFKTNTFEEAEWDEVYTNDKGEWGPYDIHDIGFSEIEKTKYSPDRHRVVFEVEYLYDGIEYEPVIPLASIDGDDPHAKAQNFVQMSTKQKEPHFVSSFAVENREERRKYNLRHAEITGNSPVDKDGHTEGRTNETSEEGIRTGNTTRIDYKKDEKASEYGRFVSRYQKLVPEENKGEFINGRFIQASTLNLGLPYVFPNKISNSSEDVEIPIENDPTRKEIVKSSLNYMQNINFGITKRPKVNASLTKDLVSAKVIVNKKALNYLFDDAYQKLIEGPLDNEDKNAFVERLFTIQTENDYINSNLQYKLDIYKTDYIYRTEIYKNDLNGNSEDPNGIYHAIEKDIVEERGLDDPTNLAYTDDTRKLDVFLTYRISLYNDPNMSSPYSVYFTQINDYYHEDLVPVIDKDIEKIVEIDPNNAENGRTEDVGPAPTDTQTAQSHGLTVRILKPKFKVYDKWTDEVEKDENKMVDFSKGFKEFTWKELRDTKEGYHMLESTDKSPELIVPAGGRADIYTNYRIKRDGHDDRIGLNNSLKLGKFYNMAEISGFAAYNSVTGKAEGAVDDYSAPNNINVREVLEVQNPLLDKSMLEADTDGAPIINVDMPDEEHLVRKVSGDVWEDFRNEENAGIRTGNGIKEKDEKPIEGQKIILEERISIKKNFYDKNEIVTDDNTKIKLNVDSKAEYVDIPFVWPEIIRTKDGEINIKELTGLKSVTKTDANGKYEFTGVPAGNFVMKTRYSASGIIDDLVKTVKTDKDTEKRLPNYYNGIDFKSTLFYGGDNDKVNTTWLGKIINGDKEKYSYLRDDEFRRLEITKFFNKWDTRRSELLALYDRDLENANDIEKELLKLAHEYSHMVATTPKINFSIEFYEKYAKDGNKLPSLLDLRDKAYAIKGVTLTNEQNVNEIEPYDVEHVNMSIVERPQTKLVLNKEIEKIEFMPNTGTQSFVANFKTVGNVKRNVQDFNKYIQNPANIEFKTAIDLEAENNRLEETLSFESTMYGLDGLITEDKRNYAQKFAYLNIDEQLLQGGTINIDYKISTYNLSEMDRKINLEGAEDDTLRGRQYYTGKESPEGKSLGKLRQEYAPREDYRFGRYIGDEYYTRVNERLEKDDVARAKITGILDVMSTTMEHNKRHENAEEWVPMSKHSLIGVLQGVTEENANTKEYIDRTNNRNTPYITESRSNILGRMENTEKDILPIDYYLNPGDVKNIEITNSNKKDAPDWMRIVNIGGTATTSSVGRAGDFSYENSAEIVIYDLDTARRAVGSAPGSIFTDMNETDKGLFISTSKQYDADTTEYVTVTPPTGASVLEKKQNSALVYISIFTVTLSTIGILIKLNLEKKDKIESYYANKPWERK